MAKADEGRGAAWKVEQPSARCAVGMRTALVALAFIFSMLAPRAFAQYGGTGAAPAIPGVPGVPGVTGAPTGGEAAGPNEAPPPAGREWTIEPGIGDTEEFTDNALFTPHNRQADLITTVTPSIYLNADTSHLQGSLNYSPQIIEYAALSSQDQVTQNLAANGTLTAVPNLLFLQASASAQAVARAGGFGYGNQATIPSTLSTQTTAYSISPYAQFHFGDTGDAEIRYTGEEAVFSGNTGPVASPVTGVSLGSLSNSTENEGSASFTTGEGLNRLKLTAEGNYTDYLSSGSSSQSSVGDVTGQYNIYEPYFATAMVGYERLEYAQSSSADYTGPRWQIGGMYQPRDDRTFSLSYGKTEGNLGFASNLNYALTELTTLVGSYQVQSSSSQQQLLQSLTGLSTLGPGVSQNPATGNPVVNPAPITPGTGTTIGSNGLPLSLTNPNLALQNAVERIKTLTFGIIMQGGERNNYSLSFNRTESDAISVGAISQTTTGGIASWNRDLSPDMTGTVSLAYSVTSSSATATSGSSSLESLTFTTGVTYTFSDTLTGSATYSLNHQNGGVGGVVLEDLALVSLNKHF